MVTITFQHFESEPLEQLYRYLPFILPSPLKSTEEHRGDASRIDSDRHAIGHLGGQQSLACLREVFGRLHGFLVFTMWPFVASGRP